MNGNPTVHRVRTPQGELHVLDHPGAGPAFVLMHGFPDNLHIYDHLAPHLVAGGRRVVAFDFLGFGASDKPPGAAYSFAQQLGDLEAVVDQLGLGAIDPVAHDSSGMAALNYALAHPSGVGTVVMLNSAYCEDDTVLWPEMISLFATASLRALAMGVAQSPEQFGWLLGWQQIKFEEKLTEPQKIRFRQFLAPLIRDNFVVQGSGPALVQMAAQFFAELARNVGHLPALKALDVPVKLIWGAFDPYIAVAVAERRQAQLRHASLTVIQAGHWLQIDEPESVAKAMLA